MRARDIMTSPALTIAVDAKIGDAIALMLRSHLSGLPVVDANGSVVGILSEGDLLRRAEIGTERHRPRWIETFLLPGRSAVDYVHTHGRLVEEVMTRDPVTVDDKAELADIVSLMEDRRIKRVPVMRDGLLVGVVTRADLLRALATRYGDLGARERRGSAHRRGDLGRAEVATLGAGERGTAMTARVCIRWGSSFRISI